MVEIKNTNIGLTLLLSSAIIYGSALISSAIYSQTLAGTDGQGWDKRYGVFGTALREVGALPIIIAILLGIAGLALIVIGKRKD